MSERTWRMIPRNRPLSFLYLLAGALLAFNSVNQLKNDLAVLPLISGLAAVGLIAVAIVGLARPGSRPRTG
ncbi:hypothetical protein ACIRL0_04850 [Streptomyces sp. NPDC102365]|uniref:hypothetical protein n=1 Tax=Streptomyces sp. NPDC102365 TaxID=3366162 RepID=UPI00382662BE